MPMTYVNLANQLSSIRAAGQHSEHSRRNPDAVWVRRGPAKGLGGNNYPPKKVAESEAVRIFPPVTDFQALQEKKLGSARTSAAVRISL